MENLFLTADSFEGRLNLSGFKNIQKSINSEELEKSYPSSEFDILEKSDIDSFIKNVYEETGGEIKKGGFNDTFKVKRKLEKAKEQLESLKAIRLRDKTGDIRTVYALVKANEDKLSKAKDTDLKKGHISNSLMSEFSGASIKFQKKGSDIIDKLKDCKSEYLVKKSEIEKEIEKCQENFSHTPKDNCGFYDSTERVKCPYKVFNWNMTYCEGGNNTVGIESSNDTFEQCDSIEEAENNRKYNDLVYQWCDVESDILAIEMYEENLDSNINYELTARQMFTLKF